MGIVADKVLLVGGPYDGCVVPFTAGGVLCMHDPYGVLGGAPDALYRWNWEPDLKTGDIVIRSATYDGPGPPRPLDDCL